MALMDLYLLLKRCSLYDFKELGCCYNNPLQEIVFAISVHMA